MKVSAQQDYSRIARELGITTNVRLANALATRLRIAPGSMVIDLGCGAAGDASLIAGATGAVMVGVDRHAGMLSLAKPPVRPILADACLTPLLSHSADAAYSVNLMQLLPDRGALFREAARILRPRSPFALLFTSRRQLDRRFLNRFFPGLAAIERQRYPAMKTLAHELRASGFETVSRHALDLGYFTVDERYLARQRSGIISGLSLLPESVRRQGLLELERVVATSPPRRVRWVRSLVVARTRRVGR